MTHQTRIFIVGLVDDMNLFSNIFETNHPENFAYMLRKFQQDTQLFSELLWTTSRTLEPQKCKYTLLNCKFDDEGKPYMDCTQNPIIKIYNNKGNVIWKIKYLSPIVSSKYLGHYKDLEGNQLVLYMKLKTIIDTPWHFSILFIWTRKYSINITVQFSQKVTYVMSTIFFSKKHFVNFKLFIIKHYYNHLDVIQILQINMLWLSSLCRCWNKMSLSQTRNKLYLSIPQTLAI